VNLIDLGPYTAAKGRVIELIVGNVRIKFRYIDGVNPR
jgi:hypothetical protein